MIKYNIYFIVCTFLINLMTLMLSITDILIKMSKGFKYLLDFLIEEM